MIVIFSGINKKEMKKVNKIKQIIIFLTFLMGLTSKMYGAQQEPNKLVVDGTIESSQMDIVEDNGNNDEDIELLSQNMDDNSPVTDTPHLQKTQKRESQPIITLTQQEWVQIQQELQKARQNTFPPINRPKVVPLHKLKEEVSLIDTAKAIILGLIISYCIKIIYNNFYSLAQRLTNLAAEDIETFQANSTEEEQQLIAQVATNNLLNRIFAACATIISINLFTNLFK